MDGISTAASVIAIVQIAQTVASTLKDYYEAVRDARDDIQQLYHSVNSLEAILTCIHGLNVQRDGCLVSSALLTNPSGPLQQSYLELDNLRVKLGAPLKYQKIFAQAVRLFKWPFQKKDVEKTVGILERHKSTLTLEIGVENLNVVFKEFDILTDIRSDIRSAKDDQDRRLIVQWLSRSVPDPSKEHNLARDKHEATTGSWLIEGEEFRTWLNTENSLLWLNGGLVRGNQFFVQLLYTKYSNSGEMNQMLRLSTDICSKRRDTPQALQTAYGQSNNGQQRPTIQSLMAMLHEVIEGFEHVYIIADAVDECPKSDGERAKLLDIIHQVFSWQMDPIHVLVTSRKEVDINESLVDIPTGLGFFQMIGVQGTHIEQDIKKFLQHRLQDRQFRKWGPDLKRDVETQLVSQADGMFRLVALQIDALGKCRAESKIRVTMKNLPKTLDAFYDRILMEIDEEDQQQAHLALKWLAYTARPISVKELAEAVIVQPENAPYVNAADRFMSYDNILEILPAGLVTTLTVTRSDDESEDDDSEDYESEDDGSEDDDSKGGGSEEGGKDDGSEEDQGFQRTEAAKEVDEAKEDQVLQRHEAAEEEQDDTGKMMIQFAHFSVKEYLISNRVADTVASNYQIGELSAHNTIAEACLAYLLYIGDAKPTISIQLYNKFTLLHYAATCWYKHLQKLQGYDTSAALNELARAFLNDASYAWKVSVSFGFDFYLRSRKRRHFDNQDPVHPIIWLSRVGLDDQLQPLLAGNLDLNEILPTFHGGPLHMAAASQNAKVLRTLIAAGADVNSRCEFEGTPLQIAAAGGDIDVVRLLLQEKADVNAQGRAYGTALQAAAVGGYIDVVRLLLQEKADVNAQGRAYGTALQAAAAGGYIDVVRLLLQEKADVNAQGGIHGTALRAAAYRGHIDVVHLLLQEKADVNARGREYGIALQSAAYRGHIDVVRLLLQEKADVNAQGGEYGTALQAAALGGYIDVVRLLLQEKADVNAQGGAYGTALRAAAFIGHIDVVRLLLQEKADVNAPGGAYGSPLRAAVYHCNKDVVEVLLEAGAGGKKDKEWDLTYKRVKKNIGRYKMREGSKRAERRLKDSRAILAILNNWLAKHEAKELGDVAGKTTDLQVPPFSLQNRRGRRFPMMAAHADCSGSPQ